MTDSHTTPDFGGGLSLDELVGMSAGEIYAAHLPQGEAFQLAAQAAGRMLQAGLEFYQLMEVWADGHTVWHGRIKDDPVVVTPMGRLIRTKE
jgi:hypothetical protein